MPFSPKINTGVLKGNIEHVDLLLVRRGEKVVVDVQIVAVGDPAPETLVNLENPTVALEAEATRIPERIEVSVEGAEAGTQIHAKDLVLPAGATLVADEDLLVVNVTMAPTAEELEVEGAGEVEKAAEVAPDWPRRQLRRRLRLRPPRRRPPSRADRIPRRASPVSEQPWLVVGLGRGRSRPTAGGRADVLETRLGDLPGTRTILARPRTYMNESGGSVASVRDFYQVDTDHLVVVHDELDLRGLADQDRRR
jgi:hypothetical protein